MPPTRYRLESEFAAFAEPARRERLVRVAHRILRDAAEAEDAVQDALLQTWRSLSSFEGRARLSTWLHRAVVNASLMRRRAALRRREWLCEPSRVPADHALAAEWQGVDADPLEQVARRELHHLVGTALESLPRSQRGALVDRYLRDGPRPDASPATGSTATRMRTLRARRAFRSALENERWPAELGLAAFPPRD